MKRMQRGSAKGAGLKHGFRSGLEHAIAKDMQSRGVPVIYETTRFAYVVPEKRHFYTPDFWLPNGIILEAKGIFDATDRAKHLLVKAQYPDLDIRFIFTRSKAPIGPGSKTTLAMWCERFGYKYADKTIPPDWYDEAGPERDPRTVIAEGPYGFVPHRGLSKQEN